MPRVRIAQMPPMPMGGPPPTAGMGAAPPMPGGPGGPVPGGPAGPGGAPPMAAPMAAPAGPPPRQEIAAPLDSIGKILYDADVNNMIENNPDMDAKEIARKVWLEYGGDETGTHAVKVGARSKEAENLAPDQAKKDYDATEDRKWERLPEGKKITDFVKNLGELTQMMEGTVVGYVKNQAKQNAGPPPQQGEEEGGPGGGGPGGPPPGGPPGGGAPPGGGGGGPMASRLHALVRLASRYEKNGQFDEADFIDRYLLNS